MKKLTLPELYHNLDFASRREHTGEAEMIRKEIAKRHKKLHYAVNYKLKVSR